MPVPIMIKVVLFDFSQTLADTAEGFRLAEEEAQTRLFADLENDYWQTVKSETSSFSHLP